MSNSQLGAHDFLDGIAMILAHVHVTVTNIIAETIPALYSTVKFGAWSCGYCRGLHGVLGYFVPVVCRVCRKLGPTRRITLPHHGRLYSIQVSTPSPSQVPPGDNMPQARNTCTRTTRCPVASWETNQPSGRTHCSQLFASIERSENHYVSS